MDEIRPATVADLDGIVDVHTRARTAYHRAGGATEDEFDTPDGDALRRAGWAAAIASAEKSVRVAVDGGEVVGVLAFGPPHHPDATYQAKPLRRRQGSTRRRQRRDHGTWPGPNPGRGQVRQVGPITTA